MKDYQITGLPDYQITRSPITGLPDYQITGLPDHQITDYRITGLKKNLNIEQNKDTTSKYIQQNISIDSVIIPYTCNRINQS